MKKILLITLLLSVGFCQKKTDKPNPCDDKRYLMIKEKPLDGMSDREYEYFTQKEKPLRTVSS